MNRIIIPPEGKEDQARFRAEKDHWLLLATSKKATKAVCHVAPFIFVHLNARRADFHWGIKRIAGALTMSVPQVERALKWLREHGLIAKLGRNGRHGTSIYALSLPYIDPSLAEGLSEVVAPSRYEGSTANGDLSTPHLEPTDPSLLGRRSLNLRGANPGVTPEEPEGCAPEAQQPSGSFLNPSAQTTEGCTGDDGSPLPLGLGDLPGLEGNIDHFQADEALSGNVGAIAEEHLHKKAKARDILTKAGFTEDRMQRAARDRYERKKAKWFP